MFDLHCFEWRWDSFEVCMECMCWLQWDFRPPAEYCSSAFSANERSKRRVDGRDAVKSLELCLRSEHWLCSVRTWISKVFLVVLWEEFQIISFSMWLRCQVSKPCTKWATGLCAHTTSRASFCLSWCKEGEHLFRKLKWNLTVEAGCWSLLRQRQR